LWFGRQNTANNGTVFSEEYPADPRELEEKTRDGFYWQNRTQGHSPQYNRLPELKGQVQLVNPNTPGINFPVMRCFLWIYYLHFNDFKGFKCNFLLFFIFIIYDIFFVDYFSLILIYINSFSLKVKI